MTPSRLLSPALRARLALAACGRAPPPAPAAPAVTVAPVVARQITDFDDYSGRVEATETVEIRPRVAGYIQKVNFREGKDVRRGELLFEIDPRPYQATLDKALADLAGAKSREELARLQSKRADELLGAHVISQDDFDQRVNNFHSAQAAVKAAEASVASARLDLGYTRITSPIDGRVSRAEVTLGNLVQGGGQAQATLLTTVVNLDPVYVYFDGSEADYLRYTAMARRGERPSSRDYPNPVEMALADEEGFPHKGHMDFVDNHVNTNTGTIRARAVFPNPDRRLTPGLFARLRLIGSGQYSATLIDDRAVGTDQDKKFVYVVTPDNKVEYRSVVLAGHAEGLRVVRQGLTPGERIVVNGLQRVRPGMTVQPSAVATGDPAAAANATPPAG
jgi:RND family efflux transporter MFP subunit